MPITAEFAFERTTKRKLVYQELDESGQMIDGNTAKIGTIYVSKWAVDGEPKHLRVTVEERK